MNVPLCPYDVPVINIRGEAEIDIIKCKGCGTGAGDRFDAFSRQSARGEGGSLDKRAG
ncbi:MAG: hypothetical protein Q7J31_09820 [Syntrophales bacterium]|nr:hypothetical protein [Syntrophales bacterium]